MAHRMGFQLLAEVAAARGDIVDDVPRLFAGLPRLPQDAFGAARRIKRYLSEQGFRDDPEAFTLPDMLARRGGNCLGLTLLIGAALLERGLAARFVLRINPRDDVHGAGEEFFALLTHPDEGVDCDSRLPAARDCTSRFRFIPVEHASLLLCDTDGNERPFEATGLAPQRSAEDPGWAPAAESVRVVEFAQLAATVYSERAKVLVARGDLGRQGEADRLVLRAVRRWPQNREAWAQLWEQLRGRRRLADLAVDRYRALGGDDSLWHYTLYRMTGEPRHLDQALARFPQYADAYYAKHVRSRLSAALSGEEHAQASRHFAIVAWCHAESEILELRQFYARNREDFVRLFSAEEYAELMASFDGERGDDARSRA